MLSQFSIGLTALRASQIGLSVTGQNIANANTPGYHRQIAQLVNRRSIVFGHLEFGTGVEVNHIRRLQSEFIEAALRDNITAQSTFSPRLDVLSQFEAQLSTAEHSLSTAIDSFYSGLQELSGQSHDTTIRRTVVLGARNLARSLHSLTQNLDQLTRNVDAEIRGSVASVNELTSQITELNLEIRVAKASGAQPNNLLDRRAALIDELSQYVDVRLDANDDSILIADGLVLAGRTEAQRLETYYDENGIHVRIRGNDVELPLSQGRLHAFLELHNETIPALHQKLDDVAYSLFAAIDRQHSVGVGISGRFASLISERGVSDVDAPLIDSTSALPMIGGVLSVVVTDDATSTRQLHEIPIDPTVDSLSDIAARISGIDQLEAVVNAETGQLSILASRGYSFDFSGLPSTLPDTAGLTGTAVPTIAGVYSGTGNQHLDFTFAGSGEVGVSDDLRLEIRSSAGELVETVDIGAGYEAGTAIQLTNGLTVSIGLGSVVSGESFTVAAVSRPDTSGFLAAVGLNTFFVGDSARTIGISQRLIDDPSALATSVTGEPGDTANLTSILSLRSEGVDPSGRLTVEEFTADFVADVGREVQSTATTIEGLSLLQDNLVAQQASYSGVDPNEEAVRMFEYQTAFEAAARYMGVVDEVTQELFALLG